MKYRKRTIVLITLAVYLFGLFLLVCGEYDPAAAPESNSINGGSLPRTILNAVWYSIVTMTTVGYGDMTPHSVLGYLAALIFMAVSLGVLAFLVSWLISMFRGYILPSVTLFMNRNKPWHVFYTDSRASDEIIRCWKQAYPDDLMVQVGSEKACEEADISVDFYPSQLMKKARDKVTFYCFGESDAENFSIATEAAALGARVYFRSDIPLDNIGGTVCYNPAISCARQFWMKHPLQAGEKKLVLIGSGRHLSALVEQALLVNIFDTDQQLEYNVYGDVKEFREDHYELDLQRDALNLSDGFPDAATLYNADRIILCMETDDENAALYNRLLKYHPFRGSLYIRFHKNPQILPRAIVFGTDHELYTPGLVIHHTMDRTAMLINELYGKQNPEYATAWEALDDYSRESNIAAADHLLTKLQILLNDRSITEVTEEVCHRAADAYRLQKDARADFFRKLEHIRWCRFLLMRNWRYENIPKRDKQARIHPLLCPYEDLPEVEQAKDDNAWISIGQIFAEEKK